MSAHCLPTVYPCPCDRFILVQARQRVLRRLAYVDGEGVVSVKGRLAASLTAGGDELVLAELVFGGAFNGMGLEALAAACSCFVFQEKGGAGGGPKVRTAAAVGMEGWSWKPGGRDSQGSKVEG